MGKKTTKTVKVPESKAEAWDEYVEENPEVDSVSHLIRLSVEKEMSGEYDVQRRRADDGNAGVGGEVLTAIQDMQSTLGDVENRLSALEEVEYAEANYDLQRAAYNALPTPPEDTAEGGDFHAWAVTAKDVAQQLGADEADVSEALDYLRETTGEVQSRFGGPEDETYYFKRGE